MPNPKVKTTEEEISHISFSRKNYFMKNFHLFTTGTVQCLTELGFFPEYKLSKHKEFDYF